MIRPTHLGLELRVRLIQARRHVGNIDRRANVGSAAAAAAAAALLVLVAALVVGGRGLRKENEADGQRGKIGIEIRYVENNMLRIDLADPVKNIADTRSGKMSCVCGWKIQW